MPIHIAQWSERKATHWSEGQDQIGGEGASRLAPAQRRKGYCTKKFKQKDQFAPGERDIAPKKGDKGCTRANEQ